MTIIDSLDTLFLMGMKEEFEEARDWIAKSLTYSNADTVSTFEVSYYYLLYYII